MAESSQGPAFEILATERETERTGKVMVDQHLRGFDSFKFYAPLTLNSTAFSVHYYFFNGLVLLHKHLRSTGVVHRLLTSAPSIFLMLFQRRESHTPSLHHIISLRRSILFCTGKLRKSIEKQVTQKNELICSFFFYFSS